MDQHRRVAGATLPHPASRGCKNELANRLLERGSYACSEFGALISTSRTKGWDFLTWNSPQHVQAHNGFVVLIPLHDISPEDAFRAEVPFWFREVKDKVARIQIRWG
jgi:hypothetical protein